MTTDHLPTQPRYAYENPTDLAWGAQLLRTARRRRLLREAEAAAAGDHQDGDDGGDVHA